MNFDKKYLKYKHKYLYLKESNNFSTLKQIGGIKGKCDFCGKEVEEIQICPRYDTLPTKVRSFSLLLD